MVSLVIQVQAISTIRYDVIKWKYFPHYWPFVWGIHRSPVNSPHKGQWRGTLMFRLICAWINASVNKHEAGDLRGHRAHYDVTVMRNVIATRFIYYTYDSVRKLIIVLYERCVQLCLHDQFLFAISWWSSSNYSFCNCHKRYFFQNIFHCVLSFHNHFLQILHPSAIISDWQ